MAPKILLIQLRQLGDILLTTPCIRELKRAWPEASLSFLAHPMGKLVLEGNPYLDELLLYPPDGRLRQQLQLAQRLRAARYDIVLDFMYNPRSALFAWLSRAPRRLAFPSRRQSFFTEIVAQGQTVESIVEEKFRYLAQLGITPESRALDLPWGPAQAAPVLAWLTQLPTSSGPRLILSPTHRRSERQWPQERFARLADRLSREWGAQVIWAWGPGEQPFVRAVQALCQRPSFLAPPTSFRESAALFAQCDLFVGNSNGPSHVAVAVDMPSLQLHGPTYARTWSPCSDRHAALQAGALLPEGRGPISLLGEEEVWQALRGLQTTVLASVAARQQNGVRNSWNGPIKIGRETRL